MQGRIGCFGRGGQNPGDDICSLAEDDICSLAGDNICLLARDNISSLAEDNICSLPGDNICSLAGYKICFLSSFKSSCYDAPLHWSVRETPLTKLCSLIWWVILNFVLKTKIEWKKAENWRRKKKPKTACTTHIAHVTCASIIIRRSLPTSQDQFVFLI